MRSWVKSSPGEAMAWMLRQPEEFSSNLAPAAFKMLFHQNPAKALELVAAQSAYLHGRDKIAASLAEEWAKTSPREAMDWAQGLREPLAAPAVLAALESWAGKNPAEARQAWEGLDPVRKQEALPAIVRAWPPSDRENAAAFLLQQPEGKGLEQAVTELLNVWSNYAPAAASQWLTQLAPGPARDSGVVALTRHIRYSDPEAAAVWEATLTDPHRKNDSLRQTLARWYTQDLTKALEWVQNAPGLTEEERRSLVAPK